MNSKGNAWLRLINCYAIEEGCKYVIDNGSGDNLIVFITKNGVFMKGFDHENELNQFAADEWDDAFFECVYDNIPFEFLDLVGNVDERDETTFCMWYINGNDEWQQNEILGNDGGKEYLLQYIMKSANEWCNWAKYYYETNIEVDVVKALYNGEPITQTIIKKINPKTGPMEVLQEIYEMNNMLNSIT
ncbi:hypothetical protein [Solibacillus sp. FSL K6-1523]|uniref:hypothetical protein n=1 Tax=Solibacillus sp. FSL K6-1523 TaxID=2921471 RepID=UPI0030FC25C7